MKAFPVVFAAAAIVAALGVGTPARTQVKVVGGPFATTCAALAIGGAKMVEAVEICTRAIDYDTGLSSQDAAKTLVNRGVIQMRRGQLSDAEKDFAAAQSTMPQLAEIYINRGVSWPAPER